MEEDKTLMVRIAQARDKANKANKEYEQVLFEAGLSGVE